MRALSPITFDSLQYNLFIVKMSKQKYYFPWLCHVNSRIGLLLQVAYYEDEYNFIDKGKLRGEVFFFFGNFFANKEV
jgi:hypothetical protein